MKDGSIVERGTHSALVEKNDQYQNFLQFHHTDHSQQSTREDQNVNGKPMLGTIGRQSSSLSSPRKKTKASEQLESIVQKLTEDDTNYKFAGLQSYLIYLKAAGGYFFAFCVFVVFAGFVLSQIFTQVWLQRWIDAGDGLYVCAYL